MPARSYRQYCALARALDLVGDRWSLLIVRNLLLGPQRWSQLYECLPKVAKNLLSARLAQLIEDGVVDHDGELYRLTDRGRELEPAMFALADWGERHAMGPRRKRDFIRVRFFMTSVRRKLRRGSRTAWVQLWIEGSPFAVRLGPKPTVRQGEHPAAAILHADLHGLRALLIDRVPIDHLVACGSVSVEGELADVELFARSWPC
jgi:DNA-binding HxlR family transcriptional regulator